MIADTSHTLDIDPTDAHAINHIIIGDIGDQETLLAACDDGDVVAISTRLIHRAAQRNIAVAQGIEDLPADDVRAFFTGNVGASAWGLAIHKEARLFAISANTHHIMIFAFALGRRPGEESSSDSEEDIFDGTSDDPTQNSDWNILNGCPAPGQRASQNLQIILRGHRTNIPNITFCNIDADVEGKYLISTDIENRNYIWDIWQQKPICTFPFTEKLRSIANGPTGKDKVATLKISWVLTWHSWLRAKRMGGCLYGSPCISTYTDQKSDFRPGESS